MKSVTQRWIKSKRLTERRVYNEHMFQMTIAPNGEQFVANFHNKTYAAEWLCWHKVNKEKKGPGALVSLDDALQIAYKVGVYDVSFRRKKNTGVGASTFYYDEREIALAVGAQQWVVLHELAHALSPQRGHTNLFRGVYLRLIRQFYGEEWFMEMKRCFKQVGISYDFPDGAERRY